MYSLYGCGEIFRNIYTISQPFVGTDRVKYSRDLRGPYLRFLENTFPDQPINKQFDLFVNDDQLERALSAAYSGSTLNDLHQESIIGDSYERSTKSRKIDYARKALTALLSTEDSLDVIFNLVIHSIFISESKVTPLGHGSHGGSASGAIGSIWLSMQKNISSEDLVELFVHELTHHLLFIDELVHSHFNYAKILHKENFAYSSILNRMRPLDKVLHSMVVATEVVLARNTLLSNNGTNNVHVHPDSEKMLSNVIRSYESMQILDNLDILITDRAFELIERCHTTCQALLVDEKNRYVCTRSA